MDYTLLIFSDEAMIQQLSVTTDQGDWFKEITCKNKNDLLILGDC